MSVTNWYVGNFFEHCKHFLGRKLIETHTDIANWKELMSKVECYPDLIEKILQSTSNIKSCGGHSNFPFYSRFLSHDPHYLTRRGVSVPIFPKMTWHSRCRRWSGSSRITSSLAYGWLWLRAPLATLGTEELKMNWKTEKSCVYIEYLHTYLHTYIHTYIHT